MLGEEGEERKRGDINNLVSQMLEIHRHHIFFLCFLFVYFTVHCTIHQDFPGLEELVIFSVYLDRVNSLKTIMNHV